MIIHPQTWADLRPHTPAERRASWAAKYYLTEPARLQHRETVAMRRLKLALNRARTAPIAAPKTNVVSIARVK